MHFRTQSPNSANLPLHTQLHSSLPVFVLLHICCSYWCVDCVLSLSHVSPLFQRPVFTVSQKKRPRQLYQWMLFSAIRWSQSWERSLVVKTIWNQNRTTKKWFKIKSSPEWFKSRLNRIILNHYQDWFVVGTTVVYWHLYGLFSQ